MEDEMPTDEEVFGPQIQRFPVNYDIFIHDEGTARELPEGLSIDATEEEYIAHLEDDHGPSIIVKKDADDVAHICCYPSIMTVGSLTIDQADNLLHAIDVNDRKLDKMEEVIVGLDYPFERKVMLVIYPMRMLIPIPTREGGFKIRERNKITVGLILWQVALAYRAIYKQEFLAEENGEVGPFGIWGHGLGDLVFEAIDIFEDGYCRLYIGS